MYTPVRRKDLFNGSWFEISEIVDKGISHGIALGGISETLAKDFQEMIRDRNVQTKFLTDDDENHQQVIANEQAERILGDPGAEKTCVFWHQSEVRTAATVWNWSGKTLSSGALLAVLHFSFVPYFSARLDFPSPPLPAPGSPRMSRAKTVGLRGGQLNATRSIVASKKIMKNSRSCYKV